jgi:hypothetical protein
MKKDFRNKNKTILFIAYLALFSALVSCSGEKKDLKDSLSISKLNKNENIINIDLDKARINEPSYISFLFRKATPIILETNDEILLRTINNIAVYDDLILVLDRETAKGVFAFNREGKFIRRFGQIGQGPGEYISPYDFTIDYENKLIYILDDEMRKINSFGLPDGSFIKSIKIQDDDIRSHYIQYYEGKLYADADSYIETHNDYMLREIDLNTGKQIACWLNNTAYNKGYNNRMGYNTFFIADNPFHTSSYSGIKFVQLFMDTIVSIDKTGVSPFLSIKSKSFMSYEDLSSLKEDTNSIIEASLNIDKIYKISNYIEGQDFIHFTYRQGFTQKTVIYDKTDKTVNVFPIILDDLVFKINLKEMEAGMMLNFLYSDKNGAYSYISTDDMKDFIELIHNDKLNLNDDQKKNLMNLTEDSNPVLLYYEYKN